jgi:hypothetical protein
MYIEKRCCVTWKCKPCKICNKIQLEENAKRIKRRKRRKRKKKKCKNCKEKELQMGMETFNKQEVSRKLNTERRNRRRGTNHNERRRTLLSVNDPVMMIEEYSKVSRQGEFLHDGKHRHRMKRMRMASHHRPKACSIHGHKGVCLPNFHNLGESCKHGSFFKGFCPGQPNYVQCCMDKSKVRLLAKAYNTLNPKALCPAGYRISLDLLKSCKYTHGENSPAEPNKLDNGNDNPDGRKSNRRVEIHRSNDSVLCNRCKDDVVISHGKKTFKEYDFTNAAMKKRCLGMGDSCKYNSQEENKFILKRYMNKHANQCSFVTGNMVGSKSGLLEIGTNIKNDKAQSSRQLRNSVSGDDGGNIGEVAEVSNASPCTPTCLRPNAKTLWECFGRDYKFYQEKISKLFNLPNTKTAEANTNLLNAWKRCDTNRNSIDNIKIACKQDKTKLIANNWNNNNADSNGMDGIKSCECIDVRFHKCNLKTSVLVDNRCKGSNNIKGCQRIGGDDDLMDLVQMKEKTDLKVNKNDKDDVDNDIFTATPSCMYG